MARLRSEPRRAVRGRRHPNPGELRQIYAELRRHPNVVSCFVGWKRVAGRSTRRLAIICGVRKKLRSISRGKCVPSRVEWLRGSRRVQLLPTDVIEMSSRLHLQQGPVLGPGDGAGHDGAIATIGAALQHPTLGAVLTTAGHLLPAGAAGASVSLTTGATAFQGRVGKRTVTPFLDYALISPSGGSPPSQNLFRDLFAVGPVYEPTPQDVGRPLTILRQGETTAVRCRGVHADVHLPGDKAVRNGILTDEGTVEGDSGCCLVDDQFRLWGFLKGSWAGDLGSYSVFLPASAVCLEEQALLI